MKSTYTLYEFMILVTHSFNVGRSCTFLSSPSHKAAPLYKGLFRYLLVHFDIRLNFILTFPRVFTYVYICIYIFFFYMYMYIYTYVCIYIYIYIYISIQSFIHLLENIDFDTIREAYMI